MGTIIEVQYGKVITRSDKQEFTHLFTGKSNIKPKGIIIS